MQELDKRFHISPSRGPISGILGEAVLTFRTTKMNGDSRTLLQTKVPGLQEKIWVGNQNSEKRGVVEEFG